MKKFPDTDTFSLSHFHFFYLKNYDDRLSYNETRSLQLSTRIVPLLVFKSVTFTLVFQKISNVQLVTSPSPGVNMASVSSSSVDSLSLFNEPLACFEFVTFVVLQVCCTGAGIYHLQTLDDASDAVRHDLKPVGSFTDVIALKS